VRYSDFYSFYPFYHYFRKLRETHELLASLLLLAYLSLPLMDNLLKLSSLLLLASLPPTLASVPVLADPYTVAFSSIRTCCQRLFTVAGIPAVSIPFTVLLTSLLLFSSIIVQYSSWPSYMPLLASLFTTAAHAGVPPVAGIPAVAGTVLRSHILPSVTMHFCIIRLSELLIFYAFGLLNLEIETE
jgi:hypothetical protein